MIPVTTVTFKIVMVSDLQQELEIDDLDSGKVPWTTGIPDVSLMERSNFASLLNESSGVPVSRILEVIPEGAFVDLEA